MKPDGNPFNHYLRYLKPNEKVPSEPLGTSSWICGVNFNVKFKPYERS